MRYSVVDLHCHSTVSDGTFTPVELAERAHAHGVKLWSLTDHDEIGGQAQAKKAATDLGIDYITGIEISVTWQERTLHIVGLHYDPENQALQQELSRIRTDRLDRAKQMGEKLASFGIDGAFEGALALAGNPELISRTHFARYMVDKGYCPDIQTVFDRYLGDGKPACIMGQWASLEQAVQWIRQAGGEAVIAHPGRYKYTKAQFQTLFSQFKDLGGKAIEVVTGSHYVEQYHEYAHIARYYGFLASCGSDFHGLRENRLDLGRLPYLPEGLTPIWQSWYPQYR